MEYVRNIYAIWMEYVTEGASMSTWLFTVQGHHGCSVVCRWCVVFAPQHGGHVVEASSTSICMEYVCNIYGICLEYAWNRYGICMEHVQNVHGIGLEYAWKMHGICMEYVWSRYWICMESAWKMHGVCTD